MSGALCVLPISQWIFLLQDSNLLADSCYSIRSFLSTNNTTPHERLFNSRDMHSLVTWYIITIKAVFLWSSSAQRQKQEWSPCWQGRTKIGKGLIVCFSDLQSSMSTHSSIEGIFLWPSFPPKLQNWSIPFYCG